MSSPFIPIQKAELDWRNNLPFSVLYDDIYFSVDSGMNQSRHVFIDGNDLISRWQALPENTPACFSIGETGFGTGLNFLLTWHLWEQFAPPSASLHFISCEKHPLELNDLIKCLRSWPELETYATELIEHYPVLTPGYHQIGVAKGRVRLTLMLGEAQECYEQLLFCGESRLEADLRTSCIDAWYLDGFSPPKNENMWSVPLLKIIAMLSREGTTMATYTAAASVKTALAEAGFVIKKRKGFGPKRHMVHGVFKGGLTYKVKSPHTPWHVSKPSRRKEKSAIIIGAGLAGAFTAHSLATRGWQVTLMEALDMPGKGGSANQQAVLFPKLSAYKSPLTQFMLSAFLYASQIYKNILRQDALGDLCGSLLLGYNEKENKAQQSIKNWLVAYPQLGELVDAMRASELAEVELEHSGLYIPLSGWINSPALCELLIQNDNIKLLNNQHVGTLFFDGEQWIINDVPAPVIILANGPGIHSFKETQHLPIKSIRGQMTAIQTTQLSQRLTMPVCADGHILPEYKGAHHLGATYELGVSTASINPLDDKRNLMKLAQLSDSRIWSNHVVGHWSGIRATTPDYLPLVGQAPVADQFVNLFSGLESNSKRWIEQAGPYYKGLYLCAGFGSRGLTSIPLCAEWLAGFINNEISSLPRTMLQALSPARFLRRSIIRGKNSNTK